MAKAALSTGVNRLRDASFSSYLDNADMDFVRSLAASVHGSSPVFSPLSKPSPMSKQGIGRLAGELGVFRADTYFSHDYYCEPERTPRSNQSKGSSVKDDQLSSRTPSIKSESSLNSQSRLLSSRISATDHTKRSSPGGLKFFSGFQCKPTCYDKPQAYPNNLIKKNQHQGFWEDQMDSKEHPLYQPRQLTAVGSKKTEEEDARMSIEVFGSHNKTRKKEQEEDVEGKLPLVIWDAIPQNNRRRSSGFDDVDSVASSDLFDIPVFPAAPMSPLIAPSEASIEWSVVTASVAEFSMVSDYDGERHQATKKKKNKKIITLSTPTHPFNLVKPKSKEVERGGILGCKSTKAVAPARSKMPPRKPQTYMNECQVFSPGKTSFAAKTAATSMY